MESEFIDERLRELTWAYLPLKTSANREKKTFQRFYATLFISEKKLAENGKSTQKMRRCPECGYKDPPIWRPAKMHNPSGDVDIARIDDVQIWEPEIAKQLLAARGIVTEDKSFAYLIGKKGVWVKRIDLDLYRVGGISAFKQPFEHSGHNPFAKKVAGRTKTTFRKNTAQQKLALKR